MLPLYTIQKFLRFPFYKISITLLFFRMSWKELPNPNTKVQKIRDNGVPYHRFYFDLQFNTSILFCLRHSDSFSKLIHFLSEPAYV